MKKVLAIILTAVMLFSALPISVSAAEADMTDSGAEVYTDGDYSFTVLDDGTAQITKYSGTQTELTVPAVLGASIPVTQIGSRAFEKNDDLEKLTIPDNVTALGEYAFYNCKNLSSITIGSGVTKLPDYVFASCTSLGTIDIPATVTDLGYDVFNSCSDLTSVTLREGVVNLGYNAFEKTGITSITIPSSVTKGRFPFDGCENLKAVIFAEGATTVLTGMFYNSGIESIVIPEGVETVSEMAF